MAICPSEMDSFHSLLWNCCGQSRMPMEAASSGVGKVISTTLLVEAEREDDVWDDFCFWLCTSCVGKV